MEPRLQLERFSIQAELEPGIAWSVGQRLTTELLGLFSARGKRSTWINWQRGALEARFFIFPRAEAFPIHAQQARIKLPPKISTQTVMDVGLF